MEFAVGFLAGCGFTAGWVFLTRWLVRSPTPCAKERGEPANRKPPRTMFDGFHSQEKGRRRLKLPQGGSSTAPPAGGT